MEVTNWVLYPFTGADIEPYLPRVPQPTLVVTSHDDDIAHPEGSRRVAASLSRGELRVEPHGDHISLFAGDESLLRMADDFMGRHPTACPERHHA